MGNRRGATGLSGVLAVDKPPGVTSHDVVAAVRRATGERRVGHAGTLDPMATGLLLIAVGPATRLERYLSGCDKRYEARIVFGAATDTLDADGAVTSTAPVPARLADPAVARDILAGFLGPAEQVPPAYSAIKTDGVAAYRRARAGEEPALAPRPIVVHEALLRAIDPVTLAWDVSFLVSKGTYVRALARDIGASAATVAHLGALRRVAIGPTAVTGALSLDDVDALAATGRLAERFIDPLPLLGMSTIDADEHTVTHGRAVPAPDPGAGEGTAYTVADARRLYAVYRLRDGELRAETVFPGGVTR